MHLTEPSAFSFLMILTAFVIPSPLNDCLSSYKWLSNVEDLRPDHHTEQRIDTLYRNKLSPVERSLPNVCHCGLAILPSRGCWVS